MAAAIDLDTMPPDERGVYDEFRTVIRDFLNSTRGGDADTAEFWRTLKVPTRPH